MICANLEATHMKYNCIKHGILFSIVLTATCILGSFYVTAEETTNRNYEQTDSSILQESPWKEMIDSYYLPIYNDYPIEYEKKEILPGSNDPFVELFIPCDKTSLYSPDFFWEDQAYKKMFLDKSHIFPAYSFVTVPYPNIFTIYDQILTVKKTFLESITKTSNFTALVMVNENYMLECEIDLCKEIYDISFTSKLPGAETYSKYYLENVLRNPQVQSELIASDLDLFKTKAYALDYLRIEYQKSILFSDGQSEYILFLKSYPYTTSGQFYHQKYMTEDELSYLNQPRFKELELYEISVLVDYMKKFHIILYESEKRAHDAGEF